MSRFEFGENWSHFVEELSEADIETAKEELADRFNTETFHGQSFIDVGCGSGIFSLAAIKLGAEQVYSFDYDRDSVACCRKLKQKFTSDASWEISEGDILNDDFVEKLGDYDLVYCWGVAHHTGNLERAVENVASLVDSSGRLCLGIYHRVDTGTWTSKRATRLKQVYNSVPGSIQTSIVYLYGFAILLYRWLKLGDRPWEYIDNYSEQRGMRFWIDVRDWVGGYPFEYMTPEECISLVTHCGPFNTVSVDNPANSPSCVNTYTFEKIE